MRNHRISREDVLKTFQMIFVSPFVFLGEISFNLDVEYLQGYQNK